MTKRWSLYCLERCHLSSCSFQNLRSMKIHGEDALTKIQYHLMYKDPRHCPDSRQCTAPNAAVGAANHRLQQQNLDPIYTACSPTSIHPARQLDTWTPRRTHQWWAAYAHSSPLPLSADVAPPLLSCNCPGPCQPFKTRMGSMLWAPIHTEHLSPWHMCASMVWHITMPIPPLDMGWYPLLHQHRIHQQTNLSSRMGEQVGGSIMKAG